MGREPKDKLNTNMPAVFGGKTIEVMIFIIKSLVSVFNIYLIFCLLICLFVWAFLFSFFFCWTNVWILNSKVYITKHRGILIAQALLRAWSLEVHWALVDFNLVSITIQQTKWSLYTAGSGSGDIWDLTHKSLVLVITWQQQQEICTMVETMHDYGKGFFFPYISWFCSHFLRIGRWIRYNLVMSWWTLLRA